MDPLQQAYISGCGQKSTSTLLDCKKWLGPQTLLVLSQFVEDQFRCTHTSVRQAFLHVIFTACAVQHRARCCLYQLVHSSYLQVVQDGCRGVAINGGTYNGVSKIGAALDQQPAINIIDDTHICFVIHTLVKRMCIIYIHSIIYYVLQGVSSLRSLTPCMFVDKTQSKI